ncbi:MAG: (d)CMP kinase [Ignavibacteriales bacterium]|nr:(d)CMP kinase [Ignavibacteriales bacterium]
MKTHRFLVSLPSMFNKFIITIDGPAGSGKSTTAKLIAAKLGYTYLDTGAMYRAITYLALKKNLTDNEDEIIKLAENVRINLNFSNGKTIVVINDEDVTEEIRSFEVNSRVSDVSLIPGVRKALVKLQRKIGENTNIVAEGRDIGTVVFPEAEVKIFLIATLEERAKRRLKEFEQKGERITIKEIQENLSKRDYIDSHREVSPLMKADGAFEVDTSDLTIEEQVNKILKIAEVVSNKMKSVIVKDV